MMDALGEARGGRPRPAPRLLPQSDRRRSRPRPVARGRRPGRAQRGLIPYRRPRLSGPRQRPRGGRRGHAAGRRGGRAGARRAELRQEFRLLSRPARHPVRQGLEPPRAPRSRSAICSQLARTMWSMPPDHGAAVVAHHPRRSRRCAPTGMRELDAMCARIRALRARLAAFDRGSPISTGRTACSRCCR